MSEPIGLVEFLGTIPIMDGALKAHGENGYRVSIDLADDELPAYMRLHLMRGKVIRFTAEATEEIATPRTRKRKNAPQPQTEEPKIISWKTPHKLKN